MSTGTLNQPIPPSMHNGTSVRLTIIATAPRMDLPRRGFVAVERIFAADAQFLAKRKAAETNRSALDEA
jgi:hypothetical protein